MNRLLLSILDYLKSYWFSINLVLSVFFLLFQIIKFFYLGNEDKAFNITTFNFYGFLLFLSGTIGFCLIIGYYSKITSQLLVFILLASFYCMFVFGYLIQSDPKLDWPGDVARGNYNAATESVKYGSRYLVSTWNDRANPYDTITSETYTIDPFIEIVKRNTRNYLEKNNLQWATGNKWKETDLLVDKNNGRAYTHSPLNSIIMGYWMKIFPFNKWSLQIFSVFLMILCFGLLFYSKRFVENNIPFLLAFIAFASSPVTILYVIPSAEQLTMLLFTSSVFVLLFAKKLNLILPFVSGVLIGFAFYSKFTVAIFIALQAIALLISTRRIGWKPLLGYVLGVLSIMLLFTMSGYYFWLTYFTGKEFINLYIERTSLSVLSIVTKFLYFGVPLSLILVYVLSILQNMISIRYRMVFIPVIIFIILFVFITFQNGAFNRYLIVYLFSLFPLIVLSFKQLSLISKRDILIVPTANFVFLCAIVYL
jgi:hypothetical protein